MYFTLSDFEISQILARAFAAGQAYTEARTRPSKELITQAEATRRFGITDLTRWRDNGLIHPQRRGGGKNHAIWYSLAEIAKAQCHETLQGVLNMPAEVKAS